MGLSACGAPVGGSARESKPVRGKKDRNATTNADATISMNAGSSSSRRTLGRPPPRGNEAHQMT